MFISLSACENPEEVKPEQRSMLGQGTKKVTYYDANGDYEAHSIPVYAQDKIVFPEWIYFNINVPYMYDTLYSGYKTYVNDNLIHEHFFTADNNHRLIQYQLIDHPNSSNTTTYNFTYNTYPSKSLETSGDAYHKFEFTGNFLYKDHYYVNSSDTYLGYSVYTRNAEGLVTNITFYSPADVVLDVWFTAQYNAQGLVTESKNNEEKSTYTYDSQGRISRIDKKDLSDVSTGHLIFEY